MGEPRAGRVGFVSCRELMQRVQRCESVAAYGHLRTAQAHTAEIRKGLPVTTWAREVPVKPKVRPVGELAVLFVLIGLG